MKDLTNFFKDRKDQLKSEYKIINFNKIKDEWISEIEKLISKIKNWLKESEENGFIELKEDEIQLSEEKLGTYKTKSLRIFFEDQVAEIVPVARIVVGGEGRVDIVKSPTEKYTLLYKNGWKYLEESGIQRKMIDFDNKCFTEIMEEIFS